MHLKPRRFNISKALAEVAVLVLSAGDEEVVERRSLGNAGMTPWLPGCLVAWPPGH